MSLPTPVTAPFRSTTFPFQHTDSLPIQRQQQSLVKKSARRRSLSEGNKRNGSFRGNKVVPIVFQETLYKEGAASNSLQPHEEDSRQDDDSTDSAATPWVVADDVLEPVPKYYPLEPSVLELRNINAYTVSTRVSEFTRIHSMASVFSKTSLEATTAQLTRFAVHLWRKDSSTILLELQRLEGSCIEMQRIRNALFHFVTTGRQQEASGSPSLHHRDPPPHCTADCIKRSLSSQEESENDNDIHGAIVIAKNLLASPCLDQNMLGMESLRILSNPTVCSHDCAKTLSRELLLGDDHIMLEPYFENIERPNDEESSTFVDVEYEQGRHFGVMHHVALQVLVNALQGAVHDGPRQQGLLGLQSSSFYHTILDAIVYNLSVAKHRPQEAAMSAQCLVLLMQLGELVTTKKWLNVVLPLLMEAHEYGKVHHLRLETSTHDLMEQLWQQEQ